MRAAWTQIAHLAETVRTVAGDFAEFGVWQGATFLPMARAWPDRACHAVDSFRGMAEPTVRDVDLDGTQSCPRGAFDVGGAGPLRQATAAMPNVVIHEGFVPAILRECHTPRGFAFAHVDLDHFEPTLETLEWLWPRVNPGGLVVCHDWFEDSVRLAAGAVSDWMAIHNLKPAGVSHETRHIWFRKK